MSIGGPRQQRVVVVTGAGSGLGEAIAHRFSQDGSLVVCVDIDMGAAEKTAARCGELGGRGVARMCDVADYDAVVQLAADIEGGVGPVDVLVNNAGVVQFGDFLDHSIEDWRWIRGVNLDGVVHGCHAFGLSMVGRGRGHVVNVSSAAALGANRNMNTYFTTKAAVLTFSEGLRADWGPRGVGVSAVLPGAFDTPITEHARMHGTTDERREFMINAVRRLGVIRKPSRVAEAVHDAVRRDRGVVLIGVEAHAARRLRPFLPTPVRERLARQSLIG